MSQSVDCEDPVPSPLSSALSSRQEKGGVDIGVDAPPMSLVQAFEGIAQSSPRGLGGSVSSAFVLGTMNYFSGELTQIKAQLDARTAELKVTQTQLTESRIELAALKSHFDTANKSRRLRNFALGSGPVLVGVAIDLLKNGNYPLSIVCAAVGATLFIIGWHSPQVGKS